MRSDELIKFRQRWLRMEKINTDYKRLVFFKKKCINGDISISSCNISNTGDSVSSGYPSTENRVENRTRSVIFLTKFEAFG